MAKSKKKKGLRTIPVEWDKEEKGSGGGKRYKPGDYHAKIVANRFDRSANKKTPGIVWKFKFMAGKYKGKTIEEWTYLTPKSLPRLRDLLEAIGFKPPKTKKKLNLDKYLGKELGITIEDDKDEKGKYKTKSRVNGFMDLETLNSEDIEDADDEEEDDNEELDEDELDEDEEDEEEDEDDDDEEDEDDDDEDDDDLDDL